MGAIAVSDLSYAHPGGDLLFSGVSFRLTSGRHAGFVGANGVGKSTLLRILVGELTPTEGRARRGSNVQVGYFAQEGQTLDHVQTWTANLGATLQQGPAVLTALIAYGSGLRTGSDNSQTVPQHVRCDLTLQYAFDSLPLRPRAAIDIINLFDAHYAYRIGNGFVGSSYAAPRSVFLNSSSARRAPRKRSFLQASLLHSMASRGLKTVFCLLTLYRALCAPTSGKNSKAGSYSVRWR